MLLGGFHVPDSSDEIICQPGPEFILQVASQVKIHHVQLDVVVPDFVDDVEGCKVSPEIIKFTILVICSKYTAGVKRIAERINVKIPVVRAADRVGNATDCARRLLLPY